MAASQFTISGNVVAVAAGGTGYTQITSKACYYLGQQAIGGTNAGTATEATTGSISVNQDNGAGGAGQLIDFFPASLATVIAAQGRVWDLVSMPGGAAGANGVYCPNGFGVNFSNAADSALILYRNA